MIHKYEDGYGGPLPKSVNPAYPDHTDAEIVCLLNGEYKSVIQDRYLRKLGHTKESYLQKFPGAPLISMRSSRNYQRAAINGREHRSRNLRTLNLYNKEFQQKRQQKVNEFLQSDRSNDYRETQRKKAKEQHSNGQADHVREYFATRYQGSDDQKKRSQRMSGKNNIVYLPGVTDKAKKTYSQNHNSGYHATRKYQFKHYGLSYQSSYEYDFLEYCEQNNLIHLVTNPTTLNDELYPRRFYLPDYVLDREYIVEIKSWWIESRQLLINPNVTAEKKELVERLGYRWLYILDKDYTALNQLFNI